MNNRLCKMETFGEYDAATPLTKSFCSRISAQEYEAQGSMETYAALQNLIAYMDSNAEDFKKILARKKQEEAENDGIFSFLKCKVLERLKGPNFMLAEITEDETTDRLLELQSEMCEVFNYAQDTKSSPTAKRFSKRLAAKRAKRGCSMSRTVTPKRSKGPVPPAPPPPPPPYPPPGSTNEKGVSKQEDDNHTRSGSVLSITPSPRKPLRHQHSSPTEDVGEKRKECKVGPPMPEVIPPPPPPLPLTGTPSVKKTPLQERTNTAHITTPTSSARSPTKKALLKSEPRLRQLKKAGSTTSLSSISSIHDELLGFDKGKLKAVKSNKSPDRTPKRKQPPKPAAGSGGTGGIISIDSFNQKILEKFKNVHSPGRHCGSPMSGWDSPSSFNSSSGFTP